jgi:hypothetical protein
MITTLDSFYLTKPDAIKGCLLALRTIILSYDKNITETVKYGMPCFCYGKKQFCYLWIDKKTNNPYILFVEGKNINHPKLEAGTRARMKILRVNPNKDLPLRTIQSILKLAVSLYQNGLVKAK